MKALIFRETGEPKSVLELAEIPTPPSAPGEALVRVLLSPINASDLHMVRGRYGYQSELPASPGIEGVGIVEAVSLLRTLMSSESRTLNLNDGQQDKPRHIDSKQVLSEKCRKGVICLDL
jgi:hypothetical protein